MGSQVPPKTGPRDPPGLGRERRASSGGHSRRAGPVPSRPAPPGHRRAAVASPLAPRLPPRLRAVLVVGEAAEHRGPPRGLGRGLHGAGAAARPAPAPAPAPARSAAQEAAGGGAASHWSEGPRHLRMDARFNLSAGGR